MRTRWSPAVFVALMLQVGCGDVAGPVWDSEATLISLGRQCDEASPVWEVPRAALDSLPDSNDLNQSWAEVARRVPGGWGGYFLRQGRGTVYLVDPGEKDAAFRALQAEGIPAHEGTQVLDGRWDFAQLYDWYRYLRLHVSSSVPGIHSQDIDEARNWIDYGVADDATRDAVARAVQKLGVPCNLLAARIQPPIFAAK